METSNYEIIKDIDILQEFIDWLPILEPSEVFYITLLARNKYCKDIVHIKDDRQQIHRIVAKKEQIIDKIRQMECAAETYKQKTTVIPQEALALYIHPNPRCLRKAGIAGLKTLVERITSPEGAYYNPITDILTAVHKSISRKVFVDFDYDCLPLELFESEIVDKSLNRDALSVVQTRGGFHSLVNLSKVNEQFKNKWHGAMQNLVYDDEVPPSGDLLLPVPGCTQGNFIPYFIMKDGVEI